MLEKMMSQKELDNLLPDYLEGRLDQVKKGRVNKLLTSLPEQKKLVEQLWANQQWMLEDRQHLIETAPTAPTKSEIRSLIENWEESTTTISTSPIPWPTRKSQRKLIFKLADWLSWPAFGALLIFVVAGAVLVSRNYFYTISFSYSQDYLSILAIWFLAAIAVWLGLFIFRNHWKMLLPLHFNLQKQAGIDNRVSGTKVLKILGTLLIWVELAGLIAALWWEAMPLYNFLTFYQISKEAKILTIALSLLGVFWLETELYRRRVNYNQTPAEWARNKLELLLSKRLYKVSVMVTLALVLLVVAPFIVNTLVSDINNPDSLPTNLTTAMAAGPDNTFLPPTYPGEIGKVNYQIGPNAQIDPAVQKITTAPVYRQVVVPWKVEDAKGFAERMGFDSTSLRQDELADAYVFTTPQKGRLILSRKVKGLWSYAFYSDEITSLPGDPINASPSAPKLTKDAHLDDQTGLNIAEKFLEGTTSLNLTYEYLTGNFNNTSFHPNYKGNTFQFLFGQTKNGQLIQGPEATVIIAADGTVEYAYSNLVALEKVDNYSLAGLDLTLQKLQDGDLPIYRSQLPPSNSLNSVNAQVVGNVNRSSSVDPAYGGGDKVTMPVSTSPNQTATTIQLGPTYSIGQQVEINGDLDATIWRDPTGQQPDRLVVILHATKGATNYNFYLYGRDILALARLDTYNLKVTGKITEVVPQEIPQGAVGVTPETLRGYRLEVTSFSKDPVEQQRIRFLGTTIVQNLNGQDYLVMQDENGSRYISEYPGMTLNDQYYKNMVAEVKAEQGFFQSVNPGQTEASLIQDTGQRIAGVPVVKKVGTSYYTNLGNSRSNAQPIPLPEIRPYPPDSVIPDGSLITVKVVSYSYYGYGISINQHMNQPFQPQELLIQPVYNLAADWTGPTGKGNGSLNLTVPAVQPS